MYRELDDAARLRRAFERCAATRVSLAQTVQAAAIVNARLAQSRLPLVSIPRYEELTSPSITSPEAMARAIARYESLQEFYEAEARRIQDATRHASASREELEQPAALVPAPRRVPLGYVVSEVLRGYWGAFRWMLFPPITLVCGGALACLGLVAPGLALAPLLLLSIYAGVRAHRHIAMLRDGEVAEIVAQEQLGAWGSSRNWPRQIARGWNVTVESYSGLNARRTLSYRTSNGTIGSLRLPSGPPFAGMVLARASDPGRALANTSFGSMPRPAPSGEWRTALPARVWVRNLIVVTMIAGWVVAVVAL